MKAVSENDALRQKYWNEQMELGSALVQKLIEFPVKENNEPFASLIEVNSNVEILFASSKIVGDLNRIFFMRESLAKNVIAIGREMNSRGWVLKIEDCYRSLEMQKKLVCKPELFDAILKKCIWENGGEVPPVEMIFRRTTVLIANIPKIGTHMSGSAIDISVYNRDDGKEVWRGNPYLEMSERTPMRSPFVESEYIKNRLLITEIMEKYGFIHYPYEFWHYNQGDALAHLLQGNKSPARYGPVNWDPKTNLVTPVLNSLTPLNPLPVLEKEIMAAMGRVGDRG